MESFLFFDIVVCLPAFFAAGVVGGGPAEGLHKQDSDGGTAAVNAHISHRRTASIHKRLVIFIKTCKAYADRTSQQNQPDAPHPVRESVGKEG